MREFNNPLDPDSKNYISPSVEIISPQEGELINSTSLTVTWVGNKPEANEYRFRLVGYSEWSDWTNVTSVTFTYLDDGEYVFEIEVRYRGQNDIRKFVRSFKVDAVKGPTLKFYRLRNVVDSLGKDFTIQVWIEEVESFKRGSFKVYFNKSEILLMGVTKGDFVKGRGFEQVIAPDFNLQGAIDEANERGYVEIDTEIFATNSDLSSLSGSGDIVKLKFKVRALRSYLELRDIVLFGENGVKIDANPTPNAIVEVR